MNDTATEHPFNGLAEIVETRSSRMANDYIAHGYVLLSILHATTMAKGDPQAHTTPYVRRFAQYILGRHEGTDAYVAPPRGIEAVEPATVPA